MQNEHDIEMYEMANEHDIEMYEMAAVITGGVGAKPLFATGGILQWIIRAQQTLQRIMASGGMVGFHWFSVVLYGIAAILDIIVILFKGLAGLGGFIWLSRLLTGITLLVVGIPALIITTPIIMPALGLGMMGAAFYRGGIEIFATVKRLRAIEDILNDDTTYYATSEQNKETILKLEYEKRALNRQLTHQVIGMIVLVAFVVSLAIVFTNPVGMIVAGVTAAVSLVTFFVAVAHLKWMAKRDNESKIANIDKKPLEYQYKLGLISTLKEQRSPVTIYLQFDDNNQQKLTGYSIGKEEQVHNVSNKNIILSKVPVAAEEKFGLSEQEYRKLMRQILAITSKASHTEKQSRCSWWSSNFQRVTPTLLPKDNLEHENANKLPINSLY